MGLFKHLLFWPVTGPSFLTRFAMEKVEGAVKTELTDDNAVKRDLMDLQMRLELGDIDDDEYVEREAELMLRLREVRRWKEQFGMATSGGLVRVAESEREDAEGPTDEARSADEEREPTVASADEADVEISLGFDED